MKITVLDSASMGDDLPLRMLGEFGELNVYATTEPEERAAHIADSDVIVLNKIKITDEIMGSAERLKLICVFATGFDNIDISAARRRGIAVCNVPGYSTDSVALFTVTTVLSLLTHIAEYGNYVKSGAYSESGIANKLTPVYHELRGKTWGIIGCGNIGRAVLRVAEAFGARVIVYKRTDDPALLCVDIDTLCRESDIITVHCPLNESTRGLINKEKIALMKQGVILVNEARGAVLNEDDIADAVCEGRLGGFGCDVYSAEPFTASHPYTRIMKYDNVLLTPHAAWGAYEARVRCLEMICSNIRSFNGGGRDNRVDLP